MVKDNLPVPVLENKLKDEEQEQRLERMRSAPMESSFCSNTWSKPVESKAGIELPRPGEKNGFSCTGNKPCYKESLTKSKHEVDE